MKKHLSALPKTYKPGIRCFVDPYGTANYPFEICSPLANSVQGMLEDRQDGENGLFVSHINNWGDGGGGNRFELFSGKNNQGISLIVCPFCGGELMSKKEANAYRNLINFND